jgi:hypothetical protein
LFKRVVRVLCYFGHKTALKYVEIDMSTPDIIYYMFLKLNIQYEYSTTLILHKHPLDASQTVV